jgi:hypothetical protein
MRDVSVRPCDGGESRFTGRPVPVEFEACLLQVVMVLFSQIQDSAECCIEASAGVRQFVSDPGRDPGIDGSGDEAVTPHMPHSLRQHLWLMFPTRLLSEVQCDQ